MDPGIAGCRCQHCAVCEDNRKGMWQNRWTHEIRRSERQYPTTSDCENIGHIPSDSIAQGCIQDGTPFPTSQQGFVRLLPPQWPWLVPNRTFFLLPTNLDLPFWPIVSELIQYITSNEIAQRCLLQMQNFPSSLALFVLRIRAPSAMAFTRPRNIPPSGLDLEYWNEVLFVLFVKFEGKGDKLGVRQK